MPQRQNQTTIKQRLANYRHAPEPAYRQKPAASMERFRGGRKPSLLRINGEGLSRALPKSRPARERVLSESKCSKINTSLAIVVPSVRGSDGFTAGRANWAVELFPAPDGSCGSHDCCHIVKQGVPTNGNRPTCPSPSLPRTATVSPNREFNPGFSLIANSPFCRLSHDPFGNAIYAFPIGHFS